MDTLIITTDNTNHSFLLFNLKSNSLTKIKKEKQLNDSRAIGSGRNTFRPFGITQNKNDLFIASHGIVGSFQQKNAWNTERLVFDKIILRDHYINTHQILYDSGHLYLTGSSVDCIVKFNLNSKEKKYFDTKNLKLIEPPENPKDVYEADITHVNSLYVYGSSLFFVNHYRGDKSQIVEINKEDFTVKNTFENIGIDCHNLIIKDNFIYFLSTGECALKQINLKNKEQKIIHMFSSWFFMRGLCRIDDNLFIAASNMNVKNRSLQSTSLFQYNLTTKFIQETLIPFEGAILDIQVLNETTV